MREKILLIEDNPNHLEMISMILKQIDPAMEIFALTELKPAYELLFKQDIGLFIVDIVLDTSIPGDTSGIRFVEEIRHLSKYEFTPVVFITSLEDVELYAYRELHCYGYVEKPFDIEETRKLLIKALRSTAKQDESKMLYFRKDGILYPVKCEDIIYAESIRHQMRFYLKNGTSLTIPSKTCRQVIQEAQGSDLIQCSRSAIINKKYIQNVDITNRVVTLIDNWRVDLGITYKNKLLEELI